MHWMDHWVLSYRGAQAEALAPLAAAQSRAHAPQAPRQRRSNQEDQAVLVMDEVKQKAEKRRG